VLGQDSGSRFPRRSWAPGYDVADVDSLIDRIEATLSGFAGPDQAVTAADVRTAKFRATRRKGYDERLVGEALDAYARQLDTAAGGPAG